MSGAFDLRADATFRFESGLLVPLAFVVSAANLLIFAARTFLPRPPYQVPQADPIAAIASLFLLLIASGLLWQRPRQYRVSEKGLEIVRTLETLIIPYADIERITTITERDGGAADYPKLALRALKAMPARIIDGLGSAIRMGMQHQGKVTDRENFLCTSYTGGVRLDTKQGAQLRLSPQELSAFLKQMEFELNTKRHLNVAIIREVAVSISSSSK